MDEVYNSYKFYNVKEKPFKIYGFYNPLNESNFRRMPQEVADNTSVNVARLNNTATGGRVRFKTNSRKIAIHVTYTDNQKSFVRWDIGFSLYEKYGGKEHFCKTFEGMPQKTESGYELYANIELRDDRERELTLYFPEFGFVKDVEVGLEAEATPEEHSEYSKTLPIVFYGSSIVHGCGISRPGNTYPEKVCRNLDSDFINLGFNGSACGEDAVIDYIASIPMSAFVFDYDHNAPNAAHLEKTHLKAYKKIREKNPTLPIILATKPDISLFNKGEVLRRIIIQKTYHYGIENGDENLYYLDGYSLLDGPDRDDCTVEGVHPNDLGYQRMATAMTNVLTYAFY